METDVITALERRNMNQQIGLDHQSIEKVYRIALTQGQYAVVDQENFEYLSQWKWHAAWNGEIGSFYAARSQELPRLQRGKRRSTTVMMHRVIMNAPKGLFVDHRNHDTFDNRKQNLRLATNAQNQYNAGPQCKNRVGLKGAHWNSTERKWTSRIKANGKSYHLGYFKTPEEAHAAYVAAARELHGEFFFTE